MLEGGLGISIPIYYYTRFEVTIKRMVKRQVQECWTGKNTVQIPVQEFDKIQGGSKEVNTLVI